MLSPSLEVTVLWQPKPDWYKDWVFTVESTSRDNFLKDQFCPLPFHTESPSPPTLFLLLATYAFAAVRTVRGPFI